MPIGTHFTRLFSIDLRSLAVFRMALGGLLLVDLYIRAQDLSAHYSDWGVLPRDVLIAHLSDPLPFSVHLVSGSSFGQAIIFLIAGLFALALLVGFRTPMVTVASWLLLLTVQARNPRVLHDSDVLLRLLLFWGMFVPLGARYSLDSLIRRSGTDGSPLPTSVEFCGHGALLLQVCLVYWCTAALKSLDVWWHEASAIYYALRIDQIVTPFGLWLLGFPDLLALLSFYRAGVPWSLPRFRALFYPLAADSCGRSVFLLPHRLGSVYEYRPFSVCQHSQLARLCAEPGVGAWLSTLAASASVRPALSGIGSIFPGVYSVVEPAWS